MKKILMVDDDSGFQKIIKLGCESIGIDIETCLSSNFYLKKVQITNYDVILLDLNMKPMDGINLANEIRKIDPDVPIYILSNYDKTYVYDRAKNANVKLSGYISKKDSIIDSIKELICA